MKAKLIKEKDGRFHLWLNIGTKDAIHIASNEPLISEWGRNLLKYKLSLKNCQAIECGYDLDELAHHNSLSYTWLEFNERDKTLISKYGIEAFKAGFQKALELLGDKKFSEEDMSKVWSEGYHRRVDEINGNELRYFDEYIQSLQQTEWDVEIVTFTEDDLKSVSEDWGKLGKPKLDADGCLILKTFKSE